MKQGGGSLELTMAITEYDHVADLTAGRVIPEGISLRCLSLPLEEIFYRFIKFREWDISEMSYGKYVSLRGSGDDSLVAIPVFPSRMHRFSSVFVRKDGPRSIEELRGLRVGIPEWAQTAAIYMRGILQDEFGISPDEVEWFQAGINQAGREEKVEIRWPRGVKCTPRPDSTLNDMLLAGEIDAVFAARPPASITEGNPMVRRLVTDYRQVEEDYWRRTGVYPIMHAVVIRREVVDAYPWVARNLQSAFEEAKRRSVERLFDMTASRLPLPWAPGEATRTAQLFGRDYWPYGIDENRRTLETFLRYAHEQGVAYAKLSVEDLFPPAVRSAYKV